MAGWRQHTIWGRSSESLPMVLKTKSCNLLTVDNRSSPSAAIAPVCSLNQLCSCSYSCLVLWAS